MDLDRPHRKLSGPEEYLLFAWSIVFWIFSLLPIINDAVAVVAGCSYQLYYAIKGMTGYSTIASNVLASVADAIPGVSWLPCIPLGVVMVILIDRASVTKVGNTALKAAGPAMRFAKGGAPVPSTNPSVPPLKNP